MDRFNKNRFTADKKETFNSRVPNMKTKAAFPFYFTTKAKMGENCRITIVEYIYKYIMSISSNIG